MRIQYYLLLAVLSTSCQKSPVQPGTKKIDKDIPALLPSGIVSGTLLPAGQIDSVALLWKGTINPEFFWTTPDKTTGSFRFTGLKAGSYTLTPVFSSKLFRKVEYAIKIDSASTTDLGTLDHQPVSLYFSINNSERWWNTYAAFTPTGFSLLSIQTSGRLGDINFSQRKLSIYLRAAATPGTYEPGQQDSVRITYSERSGSLVPKVLEWSSEAGVATLSIERIDTAQKEIEGRFSAILKPANATATNEQVIRNGHFKTSYLPL